jgi:cold shock protein
MPIATPPSTFKKGYGFIHPDDGGPNIFIHIAAVESAGMSDLKEGQRVIFEIQRDERTGNASAVSLKPLVFAMTSNLDGSSATANPFDIISAFISSMLIPEEAAPQFLDDAAPRNGMMPPPDSEMIAPPITE